MQARGLPGLTVALVYFNVATEEETMLAETHPAAELEAFFNAHCERYLAWARQEQAHRRARDAALEALRFPHEFRGGQRELAVAAYRKARDGGCLLAQAPTGIGKTLGTLFRCSGRARGRPGQAVLPGRQGPGRALALQALDTLNAQPAAPGLRVLELQARDKLCEHPDKACHGESCPLARGFYDRLPRARAGARWRTAAWTPPRCARSRRRTTSAPITWRRELTRWSDVVVGDYNYYYDATAMLRALTQASQWKVAVLADEAHNLVDRARRMYTAELSQATLARARPRPSR